MVLADKSAWERARHPLVAPRWSEALRSGRIVTAPIVVTELLYSTRDLTEFDQLSAALDALRSLPLNEGVARAARSAMRELAASGRGRHRVPIPDYYIAAAASESAAAVLHYDHDFDRLATVLPFESIWVAPPGALE